jgi:hypothetical protein
MKLKLVYKLSNVTAKAGCIGLTSNVNWDGLLDDIITAGKKDVKVHIYMMEQVSLVMCLCRFLSISYSQYIASLWAKLSIKPMRPKQKGKSKIQILDLEHKGSGDNNDFNECLGIMEKEKQLLEQLGTKLGNCQLCRPGKMCKITTHHKLSNIQA